MGGDSAEQDSGGQAAEVDTGGFGGKIVEKDGHPVAETRD